MEALAICWLGFVLVDWICPKLERIASALERAYPPDEPGESV